MQKKTIPIFFTEGIIMLFIVSIIYILVYLEPIGVWLISKSDVAKFAIYPQLRLTVLSGGSVVLAILGLLLCLLRNIQKGAVFIQQNITFLKVITGLCIVGGVIATISSSYWVVWFPIAIVAFFLGLLIWVIQSIIAEAIEIKEENIFTI